MRKTLSALFRENGYPESLIYKNVRIHQIYKKIILKECEIKVNILQHRSCPQQGFRLSIDGGYMQCNNFKSTDFDYWCETTPGSFVVRCKLKKGAENGILYFKNFWRIKVDSKGLVARWPSDREKIDPFCMTKKDKMMQSWVGNAGILFDEFPDNVVLRCNSGPTDVTFNDLKIKIEFL